MMDGGGCDKAAEGTLRSGGEMYIRRAIKKITRGEKKKCLSRGSYHIKHTSSPLRIHLPSTTCIVLFLF